MNAQSDRQHFMSIAGLPGRLTTREAAWLLGFSEHDIPVLVSHRMLKPLGDPPPNGGRYYSFTELEAFRHDTKWLDKASAMLVKHWKTQNAERRTDAPAGFMNRPRGSKRRNSNSVDNGL